MVKKDLERVNIPYETPAGIIDFHASGRHTLITELLRNGATLADARELARHGDFRMTARKPTSVWPTRQRRWPRCRRLRRTSRPVSVFVVRL